jgi:hypothetical protein
VALLVPVGVLVGIRDARLRAAWSSPAGGFGTADRLEGRAAWFNSTAAWLTATARFSMTMTETGVGRAGCKQHGGSATDRKEGKAGHGQTPRKARTRRAAGGVGGGCGNRNAIPTLALGPRMSKKSDCGYLAGAGQPFTK